MTAPQLSDLLPLATAMTASLSSEDRSRRLIDVVHRALPCDAVALLHLEGATLVPVATKGLSEDVRGRRFLREEHPRLDIICSREEPTRFPADSPLPDPYDGLVVGDKVTLHGHVHSCLGCPLRVEDELVGVLTVDALDAGAFDGIGDEFLAHLAALAGATLRTNALIERLERRAEHQGQVALDLSHESMSRRGATLIGDSPEMARVRADVDLVAASELPVLVTGETGVGKEVVVRMLHASSLRAEEPLMYVNCAALPDAIVESELFGHARGAFTGAEKARPGKLRVADGASLFLDEIGELPLHVQPKLLRALQEGEVQPVGEDHTVRVDVRLLAATNRDLEAEVAAGRFRADLLHRLDVCRIEVPPLRARPGDVAPLAGHFADRARQRLGTGPIRITEEALDRLRGQPWPGNVRELENALLRAVLRASSRVDPGESIHVAAEDLGPGSVAPPPAREEPPEEESPRPLRDAVDDFRRGLIRRAVRRSQGNWSAAARELGMDRANLHHLARRLGLK